MAGAGHRSFSFEPSDDSRYQPLNHGAMSPQQPHPEYAEQWPEDDHYGSYAEYDPRDYGSLNPQTDDLDPGTVLRREISPDAAAQAAHSLAPVREALVARDDTISPPPELETRFHAVPGAEGYASAGTPGGSPYPSVVTPGSGAPLLNPPEAAWAESRPSGSSERINFPVAGHYTDNPYKKSSTTYVPALAGAAIDGSEELVISDDEEYGKGGRRGVPGAAAAGAGVGVGLAAAGGGGGLRGGAGEGGGLLSRGGGGGFTEKEAVVRNKKKWIFWILGIIVVLAIAGGTAAGVLVNQAKEDSKKETQPGLDAEEDVKQNGELDKNSKEIQELMANPDLHKVFHGIDYTPLNAVYPECLVWEPSQNNITRDVAVLSKLTDKIRLYGNDCNQTEMVFHAIDALEVDMKVWVGVWLDGNSTTNNRQLHQLWDIVDHEEHRKKIEGIAVGNEVLYSEYLTEAELFEVIDEVRANLTERGMKIPVGTSDLGSNWNANMAAKVDVLMANVHPFFAGVTVDKAANWTWTFFEENDIVHTEGLTNPPRVMISEVGWPSGGGKTKGSVAGIEELNTFMEDFVCKENERGTEYFWFSAFDEPWKVRYNRPKEGEEWEDKWGLMDVNRNIKDGLKIPTCK